MQKSIAYFWNASQVKAALTYSMKCLSEKQMYSIFVSTYGIVFLGTPHFGPNLADWGHLLGCIGAATLPKYPYLRHAEIADDLKKNCATFININQEFDSIASRYHTYFFHEGKPSNLQIGTQFVVGENWASPNIQDLERAGILQDHSHMCKFENGDSPGFDLVSDGIQRYANAAPDIILKRWEAEEKVFLAGEKAVIEDLISAVCNHPTSFNTN